MSLLEPTRPASELRFFPAIARIAVVLLGGYTLAFALSFVLSSYPFDYLEGILVDAAQRIIDGRGLYCDIDHFPCVLLPHPPVYVGLVALLGKVVPFSVQLGRLVSFVALLGTLGLLYGVARLQAGRRAAMVAPAVFLLFVEVGYFSGLMRPEPLGFCLEILAVLVVLGRPSTGRVVLGALLFVLALYTKPNFIVGALAVAVLLLRRDRRQFVIFALTGLGAAVLVLVVGDELSGGFFSRNHVVAHISRVYAWSQFQQILFYGALPWAPILAGAILLAVRGIRRGEFDFPLVFFVISLALGLAMAPLEGSAAYYFYELYAATGLLLATRVEALSAAREGAMESALSFRRLIRGAIWLQLAVSLVGNVLVGTDRYATYRRVWKDAPALLDQLRPAPGWILVEDPILAVAAHRPVLAEIFMNSQLAQNGRWNQQPMLDLLESGGISRVVFRETPIETPNPVQLERFTPRMIAAVKKHFALSWSNESWFVYAYHPSGPSASPQPVPR